MKKLLYIWLSIFSFVCFFLSSNVFAISTRLIIRAKANDAKFIGSAVGGLKVIVRDAFNKKILAVGSIEGGTGSTKVIMKEPIIRGKLLSKGGAAKAEFVFDINDPVKLEIELIGPLASGLNIHKEVKTTWLIPGNDIVGDGIVFNLYGLIVHPYSPNPHQFYKLGDKILIGAHVSPMCGCPVMPNGLWNSKDYIVKALIYFKNKKITELPMKWAGRVSDFETHFIPSEKGNYKIIIEACNSKNNNQGVAVTGFVVAKK